MVNIGSTFWLSSPIVCWVRMSIFWHWTSDIRWWIFLGFSWCSLWSFSFLCWLCRIFNWFCFLVSVLAATALAGVKLVFNAFGASATGATYLEAFWARTWIKSSSELPMSFLFSRIKGFLNWDLSVVLGSGTTPS